MWDSNPQWQKPMLLQSTSLTNRDYLHIYHAYKVIYPSTPVVVLTTAGRRMPQPGIEPSPQILQIRTLTI